MIGEMFVCKSSISDCYESKEKVVLGTKTEATNAIYSDMHNSTSLYRYFGS